MAIVETIVPSALFGLHHCWRWMNVDGGDIVDCLIMVDIEWDHRCSREEIMKKADQKMRNRNRRKTYRYSFCSRRQLCDTASRKRSIRVFSDPNQELPRYVSLTYLDNPSCDSVRHFEDGLDRLLERLTSTLRQQAGAGRRITGNAQKGVSWATLVWRGMIELGSL
jgi:hypothetical protein